MLLLKKETISEQTVRDAVKDADGRELVKIRLSYPVCGGNSPFAKRFSAFYRDAADAFAAFARKELAPLAEKHPEREPCGAVLKATVRGETGEHVAVTLDASVFDGEHALPASRSARVWDKKAGFPVGADDFLGAEGFASLPALLAEKEGAPGENRKKLRKEDFWFTPDGFAFILPGNTVGFVSFAELKAKNMLKKCP